MANPIELLVQLKANRGKSDIDTYVNELRNKYQRNPIDIKVSGNSFDKVIESAKKLQAELTKVGSVSSDRLASFSNAINGIANSSLSAQAKITHLTRAMESVKNSSNNVKFNNTFADGIQRATANLNTLDAKIKSMQNNNKLKFDSGDLADATLRANALRQALATTTNPTQLQELNRTFRTLSNEVNTLEGRSNSLGNSLSEAFKKFPVWILASTAFYAPIRGFQDLTKQVIELDTAMVSLSRVF